MSGVKGMYTTIDDIVCQVVDTFTFRDEEYFVVVDKFLKNSDFTLSETESIIHPVPKKKFTNQFFHTLLETCS